MLQTEFLPSLYREVNEIEPQFLGKVYRLLRSLPGESQRSLQHPAGGQEPVVVHKRALLDSRRRRVPLPLLRQRMALPEAARRVRDALDIVTAPVGGKYNEPDVTRRVSLEQRTLPRHKPVEEQNMLFSTLQRFEYKTLGVGGEKGILHLPNQEAGGKVYLQSGWKALSRGMMLRKR